MGEPMDLSKRVFWEQRSFEDAYPTVEVADVEYTETGNMPDIAPGGFPPESFTVNRRASGTTA